MRRGAGAVALAMLAAGCPPLPPPPPLGPLQVNEAIEIVNRNAGRVSAGLRATGAVRGSVLVTEGRRHHFDLHGTLLVIPPRRLRFDVQNAFGRTEFLLGSNEQYFWSFVSRDDDTLRFGRYDTADEERAFDVPVRPDWLMEALGLNALPADTTGPGGPVQIIEDERQELLFIEYDGQGQGMVRKEYWLSRRDPRLVERVVFRDEIGCELMRSQLSDYKPLNGSGPLLAHHVRVDWPTRGSWLELQVNRWRQDDRLTPQLPAFDLPAWESLIEQYDRVIDIDSGRVSGPSLRE